MPKLFIKAGNLIKAKFRRYFQMKHMQDFQKWLSDVNTTSTFHHRRLAALTRLDRTQLSNVSSELSWFQWDAPQSSSTS